MEHGVQFLQRLVSRILVRSALRIKSLNCFKDDRDIFGFSWEIVPQFRSCIPEGMLSEGD